MFIKLPILLGLCFFVHAWPAKSVLPMTTDNLVSHASLASVVSEPLSELNKRDITFHRTLRATYFYWCPLSGRKRRDFQWRADWRHSDSELKISAEDNVSWIGDIMKRSPAFQVPWRGYFCTQIGLFMCSYIHSGTSDGSITDRGIIMGLITLSNDPREDPSVTELCSSTAGLPPNTCPVPKPGEKPSQCIVVHVEVNVVHHPVHQR